ncbi:MAG: adenylate/guanylate cyclase domain-containing protein [Mycobacterium sp.]|uniref:adenylate/guanylate cyclase domain-containing protein n=1 Tax=Mycobacterium sp. TaxID=1785 RepID=UPI003BAED487
MDDTLDPDIEKLLGDLEGSARAERAELIEWLFEQGVTADEIRNAFAPMLLISRRVIGDDGTYMSAREISESYGVDLELLQRVQRAIGLSRVDDPDAVVHMRADGVAATYAQRFIEMGLNPDNIVLVVRVLAEGLAHAAEVMRYTALASILRPGATELEIAKDSQALVTQIKPLLGPMIEDMLFMHLRHSMETEAVNASERAAGAPLPGARHITVAFADLVGFTRLGEEVPAEELGQLANRLADLARDVAVRPVRFVKTIGDAVMFVCTEPAPLLDAVLKLVEITDGDNDFPRLRAGIASGSAVSRAGDWFGSPVNLASRVTAVARPGAVLAAESTRDELGDDAGFSWSFAGARHLKGIKGEPRLFRARRGDGDTEST